MRSFRGLSLALNGAHPHSGAHSHEPLSLDDASRPVNKSQSRQVGASEGTPCPARAYSHVTRGREVAMSTTAYPGPSNRSIVSRVFWLLGLVLGAAIVVYASRLIFHPPHGHFREHYPFLVAHIFGGSGALLFGPWQFSRRLRSRYLNFHRWLGRFYLVSVLVGSISGFILAVFSEGGLPTHLGFGILAVVWFYTGLMAYISIRAGRVDEHRQWMIRNFALALAAVTLRIYLPFMLAVPHWEFMRAYVPISWLCWVPNLVLAEWLIRTRPRFAS